MFNSLAFLTVKHEIGHFLNNVNDRDCNFKRPRYPITRNITPSPEVEEIRK